MPPPSYQGPRSKPSFLLALVCASIVAAYRSDWLARPVCDLVGGDGDADGARPERISRLKARLLASFEALLSAASRRGRRKAERASPAAERAPLAEALLTVATSLLADMRIRRRALQDRLVCAFERLHSQHATSLEAFCAALAIPPRTFRSWRHRSLEPRQPPSPPVAPPPRRNDRATGRFDLDVTAPDTQLGADTTDLRLFGVDLKLVAVQDLGAREQRLWEAFALDDKETAALVSQVVAEAVRGRQGLQLITDQGTPYLAAAAKDAYDALGVEHAPQKEHTPTDKSTVERAFGCVKGALGSLLELTNRLADAVPQLRRPDLARPLATLLVATFLRVYIAGRRHLAHPLVDCDPDRLRAIIAAQRENARAEDRSVRLFLEAVHAQYAMPGPKESFVRAFRNYPLEDLKAAERRFRNYACRCVARVCDRYFAAVVRDAYEHGSERRSTERAKSCAAADARRAATASAERFADLRQHPDRRLAEGLDILAQTWSADERRFLFDGRCARVWLRLAVIDLRDRGGAAELLDTVAAALRAWEAAHPKTPPELCAAARRVLTQVITDVHAQTDTTYSLAAVAAILASSAQSHPNSPRPPPSPRLRI